MKKVWITSKFAKNGVQFVKEKSSANRLKGQSSIWQIQTNKEPIKMLRFTSRLPGHNNNTCT